MLPIVLSKCKLQQKNMTFARYDFNYKMDCKIVSCDEPYFNAFDHIYSETGYDYELFSYDWRQPLDLTKPLFHNAEILFHNSSVGSSNWIKYRIINNNFINDICEIAFNDITAKFFNTIYLLSVN